MQTDEDAARELMAASRGDAYDKQLALLLRRRKEARDAGTTSNPPKGKKDADVAKATEGKGPEVADRPGFAFREAERPGSAQQTASYALVVVTYNFRHLPRLSEKTKEVATALFESLVGTDFNRFSHRGSKLLINPSVVEFQDSMAELARICAQEAGSSFFLLISTHGARVSGGQNAGSYMLFGETRLSSEDELLLTAVHLHELARMIHAISCKSKFIALELCQLRQPTEKAHGEAPNIHFQVESGLVQKLYAEIVQLEVARVMASDEQVGAAKVTEQRVKTDPTLLNIVIMESCDVKSEVPVRSEDGVSNFVCRFNDAFRGGAIRFPERSVQSEDTDRQRHALMASEVLVYVEESVREDAAKHNAAVQALYLKQVRTKYELAAEFEEIRQRPQIVGTVPAVDFSIGVVPDNPRLAPSAPIWVASTLSSLTLSWSYPAASALFDLPVILGFEIQIRGHGRASEAAGESEWKTAAALQILSYEQVARCRKDPPTQVVVHGLTSDTMYCFRVRAMTAGGWGSFSKVSPAFRTQAATSTIDAFGVVKASLDASRGASSLVRVMLKHPQSGILQRQCVEVLAKLAIKGPSHPSERNPQLVVPKDMQAVLAARDAMIRFKKDCALQRNGCMLFGRLAANSASWRAALLSLRDPDVLTQVQQTLALIPPSNQETRGWCDFALRQLTIAEYRGGRLLTKAEAAQRIQDMYRRKKARRYARALAMSVYQRLEDPASGQTYYYNYRTGTSSWSMPAFLQ